MYEKPEKFGRFHHIFTGFQLVLLEEWVAAYQSMRLGIVVISCHTGSIWQPLQCCTSCGFLWLVTSGLSWSSAWCCATHCWGDTWHIETWLILSMATHLVARIDYGKAMQKQGVEKKIVIKLEDVVLPEVVSWLLETGGRRSTERLTASEAPPRAKCTLQRTQTAPQLRQFQSFPVLSSPRHVPPILDVMHTGKSWKVLRKVLYFLFLGFLIKSLLCLPWNILESVWFNLC